MYVPEMIFGHLLTSSNYDDSVQRFTGGRHGYGAKLTNIFSKRFEVEIVDPKRKKYVDRRLRALDSVVLSKRFVCHDGVYYTRTSRVFDGDPTTRRRREASFGADIVDPKRKKYVKCRFRAAPCTEWCFDVGVRIQFNRHISEGQK